MRPIATNSAVTGYGTRVTAGIIKDLPSVHGYETQYLTIEKKRSPGRIKQPLTVPTGPSMVWSLDFMSDALIDSRKFRLFNVMDDFDR